MRSLGSRSSSSGIPTPFIAAEDRSGVPGVHRLPGRIAYGLVTGVIGLGLFASVTPSPLYQVYAALWHFSALTLTLIYATYAFGVLAMLVLAGSVSDQVGRRPVLLVSMSVLMTSTVIYMVANSVAWLFIARGLQGLATGAALSAASAAMIDLHPNRDAGRVGITNGVVSAIGLGLGTLVASSLVQLGWEPRVAPYIVLFGLFAIALTGALFMPEPVIERQRFRLSPQRPSVPGVARHPFLLAGLAVLSSWSIGGLFFSLGPELSAHLFDSSNVIFSGFGTLALAGSAALAGALFGRIAPWQGTSIGSVALSLGMLLIVTAAATNSSAIFLIGSVIGGLGFGLAFLGGLRGLVAVIPTEHRGAVMSAFYIVAYASLSLPAVLAGIAVSHLGLQPTFEIFGSVVAGIALIVAFEAFRTRPTLALSPKVLPNYQKG